LIRIPAHFSGIYSLKCSTGRIPKYGNITSMAGQEGIPAVYSPMTRTLDDLGFFLKVIIDMKPWNYDYSVHPIPWREVELPKKCKIGVIYDDGVVTPAPACARALEMSVDALKKQGHDVVEFDAPSPLKALRIASQLLISDGGKVALRKQVWGEHNDAGVERMVKAARLPRFVMKLYAWYLEHIKGDKVWATLVRDWHVKTITERWDLVAERESYKAEFHQAWQSAGIDFLITVPNATPALPHKGLVESISSCGYTFLFNLLDYTAGVLPVTKVDKSLDAFDVPSKGLNRVARGAYVNYDSAKMHGLPVGVQVVGQRLQEELTFKAMQLVEQALRENGVVYIQKSVN
jgi:Asp-tRNA(Asn)/Glu-tRNA(Gln) amidotransferase A subunit family amidase